MNDYVKTYKSPDSKRSIPTAAKIIYALTALTAVFHIISFFSSGLSDFINKYISSAIRFLLAKLTGLVPFSLAEALIFLLPILAFLLIRFAVKNFSDSWRSVCVYMASMLSVACAFYILFFWSFGVGYNTEAIDKKLGIERESISAEELYETAQLLCEKVNEASKNIHFRKKNFSVMPYSISELSDKLCSAFENFTKENDILSNMSSNLKPVIMSEAMSYTHITGVYTYFTGEANINVSFPDYTLPFTAAHELAHQRGIAREDEANFIAFLVCTESDDHYLKYSGYLSMLEYFLSAIYYTAPDLYPAIIQSLNYNTVYEMSAYHKFFDKYRDSFISDISSSINDAYLKLNGTEGEISYGLVIDLAVAYYKKQ